jgi:hypothetical protein
MLPVYNANIKYGNMFVPREINFYIMFTKLNENWMNRIAYVRDLNFCEKNFSLRRIVDYRFSL